MKIEIIEHYEKNDNQFWGDYLSVEVRINGKRVRHYGDYYHDKGNVRAEAFVDGIAHTHPTTPEIIKTKKADGKES